MAHPAPAPVPVVGELGFPPEAVGIFVGVVALSVAVDLFLHRKSTVIKVGEAAAWSVFWVALAMGFWGYLFIKFGPEHASLFLSGYVLEQTLSIDNLMLFMAVFSFFRIEGALQHRILYWGIIGAMVFRGVFVAGAALLTKLGPYADLVFAVFIGWSGWMMLKDREKEEDEHYDDIPLVRIARKFFPVFPYLDGQRFFISATRARALVDQGARATLVDGARTYMTPAFVCLLVIEASDVLFAFDSVPAVYAITREPLLVYSSMIFAILGLRSMYFVLAAMSKYLVYLEKSVIALLFFIAAKMMLHAVNGLTERFRGTAWPGLDIPSDVSLYIILGTLALGIIASLVLPPSKDAQPGA
jgi:tellurite resistance protein TerC